MEIWNVSSGGRQVGELTLENGLLSHAEVSLYLGHDVIELLDKLFTAIYDNSGKSTIKEESGNLTRSRAALAEMEAREIIMGKSKFRLLFFRVGEKQFRLSCIDGNQNAHLSELIIKKLQPASSGRKPPK